MPKQARKKDEREEKSLKIDSIDLTLEFSNGENKLTALTSGSRSIFLFTIGLLYLIRC